MKKTFSFTFETMHLVWALVALEVLTIFLWKPWETRIDENARTTTVTGEAKIEVEPDLFQFSPSFTFEATTQEKVLTKVADKAETVIAGLKKLGVEDKKIKLDASSYENYWMDEDDDNYHSTAYITVETEDKALAQKIQDYLVKQGAEGQITPYATLSDETRDEIDAQARAEAITDAREKAELYVDGLDLSLGAVISVTDGYGFGDYPIAYAEDAAKDETTSGRSSLPIQPGETEYTFSVTVVYEIK